MFYYENTPLALEITFQDFFGDEAYGNCPHVVTATFVEADGLGNPLPGRPGVIGYVAQAPSHAEALAAMHDFVNWLRAQDTADVRQFTSPVWVEFTPNE